MAAASREMGGYIQALEPQLSPIQVTRCPTHPSSPLAKCIKRPYCHGNLGVQRLRWQMVSGLGEGEWLIEDKGKGKKGQGEEVRKETAQHADIGEMGMGTCDPGVDTEWDTGVCQFEVGRIFV